LIRAVALLWFWGISILLVGPPLVFYAALTGNVNALYSIATRLGRLGVLLVGVKIQIRGLEHLQPGRNYIFMSNHVSNLDPPILLVRSGRLRLVERAKLRVRARGEQIEASVCIDLIEPRAPSVALEVFAFDSLIVV